MALCSLCNTDRATQRHHLIPLSINRYSNNTIPVCRLCHIFIHLVFKNKQLANTYNTIESIVETKQFQEFKFNKLEVIQDIIRQRRASRQPKFHNTNYLNKQEKVLKKYLEKNSRTIERVLGQSHRLTKKERALVKKFEADGWTVKPL